MGTLSGICVSQIKMVFAFRRLKLGLVCSLARWSLTRLVVASLYILHTVPDQGATKRGSERINERTRARSTGHCPR